MKFFVSYKLRLPFYLKKRINFKRISVLYLLLPSARILLKNEQLGIFFLFWHKYPTETAYRNSLPNFSSTETLFQKLLNFFKWSTTAERESVARYQNMAERRETAKRRETTGESKDGRVPKDGRALWRKRLGGAWDHLNLMPSNR